MEKIVSIESANDLFYRCKFEEVLKLCESSESLSVFDSIAASAYYELHHIRKAKKRFLNAINKKSVADHPSYLYSLAKLSYYDENYGHSLEVFTDLFKFSDDQFFKLKALLGIANIYWTQKNYTSLKKVMESLKDYEPIESVDSRVSLCLLLGHYHLYALSDYTKAYSFFSLSLSLASKESWLYFMQRSVYGMACLYQKQQNDKKTEVYLDLLNSLVDSEQSRYFTYLVNSKFYNYHVTLPIDIEFDNNRFRVLVHRRWIDFKDSKSAFFLLNILNENAEYFTYREIAEKLWPDEPYNREVHEKGINQLIETAKSKIELYTSQPNLLQVNSKGVRLSVV